MSSNLSIHIELENSAFEGDNCGPEVAHILEALAKQIRSTSRGDLEGHSYTPRDANGNCVGTCDFEIDDEEEDDLAHGRQGRRDEAEKFLKQLSRGQVTKVLAAFDMTFSVEQETYRLKIQLREHIAYEQATIDDVKHVLDF